MCVEAAGPESGSQLGRRPPSTAPRKRLPHGGERESSGGSCECAQGEPRLQAEKVLCGQRKARRPFLGSRKPWGGETGHDSPSCPVPTVAGGPRVPLFAPPHPAHYLGAGSAGPQNRELRLDPGNRQTLCCVECQLRVVFPETPLQLLSGVCGPEARGPLSALQSRCRLWARPVLGAVRCQGLTWGRVLTCSLLSVPCISGRGPCVAL